MVRFCQKLDVRLEPMTRRRTLTVAVALIMAIIAATILFRPDDQPPKPSPPPTPQASSTSSTSPSKPLSATEVPRKDYKALEAKLTASLRKILPAGKITAADEAKAKAAGTRPRVRSFTTSGSNLLGSNPTVTGGTGYQLASGAVYDAGVSRGAGGSIRIGGINSQVISPPAPVTASTVYTLSAFMRADTAVSDNVIMWPVRTDSGGGFISLIPYFGGGGVAGQNTWEESAFTFTPNYTGYVAILACRCDAYPFSNQGSGVTGNLWFDDFAVMQGPGVQVVNPGSRVAFNGTQTRVDSLGNISYWNGSAWVDWFPFCVPVDGSKANWALLSSGFDCNTWSTPQSSDLSLLTKARNAGMRSLVYVSQYRRTYYDQFNYSNLTNIINAINANAAESPWVWGYWDDNEMDDSYTNYNNLYNTIKTVDVSGGVRRRPILMLRSFADSRIYRSSGVSGPDFFGSYYNGSAFGGEQVINNQLNYDRPRSMCQINDVNVSGAYMRTRILGCMALGGKMISIFRDGTAGSGNFGNPANPPPAETHPYFSEMANIRTIISNIMPFVKAAEATNWRLTTPANNDTSPLMISTREIAGTGHTLAVNPTGSVVNVTFTNALSPYAVNEIRDYATNALITTPAGASSWTLSVPANSYILVKLLPTGGATTTTTTTPATTTTTTMPPGTVIYDDNDLSFLSGSSGPTRWAYSPSVSQGSESAGWAAYTGAPAFDPRDYALSNHVTNKTTATLATATFKFNGTSVQFFGAKRNDYGQFSVSIDGGAATTYDSYSATELRPTAITPVITTSAGDHTAVITPLGTKNASSTNYYVVLDYAVVAGSSTPTTTTTTTTTTIAPTTTSPNFSALRLGGQFTVLNLVPNAVYKLTFLAVPTSGITYRIYAQGAIINSGVCASPTCNVTQTDLNVTASSLGKIVVSIESKPSLVKFVNAQLVKV